MHAQVGDWIVVESARLDGPRRAGQVVELFHPDGSPPYYVHWLDNGGVTLAFPGADARVLSYGEYQEVAQRRSR
jgi:hypothetical protein